MAKKAEISQNGRLPRHLVAPPFGQRFLMAQACGAAADLARGLVARQRWGGAGRLTGRGAAR